MKKVLALLFTCFFTITLYTQTGYSQKDLDFENVVKGKPKNWVVFGSGNYKLGLDTTTAQKNRYSAFIEYLDDQPNFKAWAYHLPAIYEGKKIKLSGYIKTENVSEGHAALWMRIDPSVAFDNMNNRGVKGTSDWNKYEIELDLNPSKAEKIVFGGMLVGKGKMWIDNLELTIDGKPLDEVPLKELSKAQQDKEFVHGSKIDTIILNDQKTNDLKILGLVWGFLKYYHPNIASGDFNWDFELFRILPKIIEAKNTEERDDHIAKWIRTLGEFDQVKKTEKTEELSIKPDLDWINPSNLSSDLKGVLFEVKNAKRTNENYYVGLIPGVANPDFKEELYPTMKYPDVGFRLLSLYRYWNIIQYYFPYKNLIEEDWKEVLSEFIPLFIHAENELSYKLAVLKLIARVHDTHANIWDRDMILNQYWGEKYAPVELTFVEEKAIVTGYYDESLGAETDLKIGDEIIKINGEIISDIVTKNLKYTPASNYPTQLRDIARKLLRTNDSLINIEYGSNGKFLNKSIRAYSTKELNIYKKYQNRDTCFKFINDDIAYLHLGSIKNDYLSNIFDVISETKGLIIDLRCYPSDFVVFTLGKYLLPKSTEFVRFSNGSIKEPGQFTYTESLKVGQKNKDYYKGKIVILINETTQSNAEYTSMAFRVAPKATVIGSTTAGADGNISRFSLPGNIQTAISGIGVYYPDKTETQRVGIIPDIEVKPTIEGIRNGRDELLEKAIEIIEN